MKQVHGNRIFFHLALTSLFAALVMGCAQTGAIAQSHQVKNTDQSIQAATLERSVQTGIIDQSNQTVYVEFLVAQPGRQQPLVNAVRSSLRNLSNQPNFVWSALHRSIDSDYVVAYTQFQNREALESALSSKSYQARVNAYTRLTISKNVGQYQVASINMVEGPSQLEVKTGHPYAVIIDRVSVPAEQYEAVLARTIGNGAGFKAAPGFQAAAVLPVLEGQSKTQIATYAHWKSVSDFLGTVSQMIGRPLTTMDELNKALAEFGGNGVTTEYHAYEVVTVLRSTKK
jgi:Antibiotic biosynthesis monooxygenase